MRRRGRADGPPPASPRAARQRRRTLLKVNAEAMIPACGMESSGHRPGGVVHEAVRPAREPGSSRVCLLCGARGRPRRVHAAAVPRPATPTITPGIVTQYQSGAMGERRRLPRLPRRRPQRHHRHRGQGLGRHVRRLPSRPVRGVHRQGRDRVVRQQARPGLDAHARRRALQGHARGRALRDVRALPQHRLHLRRRLGRQVRLVPHAARLLRRRGEGAGRLRHLPHGPRPRADRHVGEEQARRRLRDREGARRRRSRTRADLRHLPPA